MKLNCSPGDLAITVQCALPQNAGKIVEVIEFCGLEEWPDFDEPIPVWFVRAGSTSQGLVFRYPDGTIEESPTGFVPDCFLKPITPPNNSIRFIEESLWDIKKHDLVV